MLKEVILCLVRPHQGAVQAEEAVVAGAPVLHVVIRALLGHVAAEGLLRHLKGGFPAEGVQRLPPVHIDDVFLPQVDVALGHIPCPPGLCGPGVFFCVCRKLQALHGRVGAHPVGAVAVFSLQVLGQEHVRLKPPDPFRHRFIHPVFAPVLILLCQGKGKGVPEPAPDGVVSDPAVPQAVQQLQPPVGHGGHQHAHLHRHAPRPGIGGQRSAEPKHLVVRVGHQQHQVRLLRRGLPLLRLRGKLPLAVHPQLHQVEMPLFPRCVDHPEAGGPLRQGQIVRQEESLRMSGVLPGAVRVLHLQAPGVRMLIPLHLHAGGGPPRGCFHLHAGAVAVAAAPVGFIVPVRALPEAPPGGHGAEMAGGGDILRRLRPGARAQGDHQRKQQAPGQAADPSVHRSGHGLPPFFTGSFYPAFRRGVKLRRLEKNAPRGYHRGRRGAARPGKLKKRGGCFVRQAKAVHENGMVLDSL